MCMWALIDNAKRARGFARMDRIQIGNFYVMETDGAVISCAALFVLDSDNEIAEIAAFAVLSG